MVQEKDHIPEQESNQETFPTPVRIPDRFIYELVRGKPVYYKGWQEAFLNEAITGKIQEMGSSTLQGRLILAIAIALGKLGIDENYVISGSELGLHLGHKDNRCLDLAICDKATYEDSDKYLTVPPKVVIEVDIQAELKDWDNSEAAYYRQKTQDLLDFGIEKVIWVFTDSKMVSIATNEGPWLQYDWNQEIEVIDGQMLSIGKLI